MGLGSSLDVAADRGADAIGLDINPLACLASEARLQGSPSSPDLIDSIEQVKEAYRRSGTTVNSFVVGFFDDDRYQYARKWFRKDTLEAVLRLLIAICQQPNESQQRIFFIGAAQTIREVASVDPRCTHHLVRKDKPFIDPLGVWVDKSLVAARATRTSPVEGASVSVLQGNALELATNAPMADVLLVHPPYLGVIHYNQIHRLATDLLDYVAQSALHPATLRRFDFDYGRLRAGDMSTDNEGRYQDFIQRLAPYLFGAVKEGGRCVVVIGDQRFQGRLRHPFTDFVMELESAGFLLEENFIWLLQNNGGMHILRKGNFIDHNYILVFRK
jgi:hypothetical protein